MTACWLIAIVLALVAVFLTFALCRIAAGTDAVDESRSRVWDEELGIWVRLPYGVQPGPGQLTEAEVNALDRFQIALNELATDPEFTARRERLYGAVRDNHDQKGDQA
jgi:ABC-type amino acid transport system permease subunit